MVERRKKDRKIAQITAYCKSSEGMKIGYTLDISESGMFIKTNDFFTEGEDLSIEFEIPGQKKTLKAKGKVAWATPTLQREMKPDLPGCGIAFTEITKKALSQLSAYIKQATGESIYTDEW